MPSALLRTSGLVSLFVLAVAGASCAAGSTDAVIEGSGSDTGGTGDDTGGGGDETGGGDSSTTTDTGSGTDGGDDGSTDGTSGDGSMTDGSGGDSMSGESGGDGGACSLGCPVGKFDIDGDPLTGECGCEYICDKKGPTDPIDPDYKDDNCDGTDGVVEKCIFVSASTGDDTATGTRLAPMKTIAAAIAAAKAKGTGIDVCLSGGTYSGLVTMESGVSVYGGFDETDATFKFRRSDAATTNLNAEGTVVYAPKIDADTHLEGLN
ncbi:MAG: DUF1565 domain-containing protein, partial [Polyangiales bacterium]